MKINKEEIVEKISTEISLSKKDVKKVINELQEIIMNEVNKGNEVALIGFGVFKAKERTRKDFTINGKKVKTKYNKMIKFKAGQRFQALVG